MVVQNPFDVKRDLKREEEKVEEKLKNIGGGPINTDSGFVVSKTDIGKGVISIDPVKSKLALISQI
jgi:hypothetical protein